MNTKLTLTIDKSVIKQAKAYAEQQGRSLSAVVENYLKAVIKKEEIVKDDDELSPIIKSLMLRPKVELPDDYDYKKELEKVRDEKYQKYLNNNER
ncbi:MULTISPECIES: DUF6364 family protein [Pedobacter]|uniref:Antitoxin n=1 Tax=Pedobacter ginsenosidimutans TaxID=687842 RepID=A0A0T5VS42_9SPHI|nr:MULTISPECIES: DUF6364 family protein [Pedobacter]KRT16559.1 hypothetical protein ASU31_08905 [Pedobacter ginsenosidimutans]MDQ0969883.1 antitoxin component of RelBE/YafQ-DinJ toxin-antitoxin module [Flavobacterium sp. W4I14]NMN39680.1 antitoxin component of RelBE/YafQ-DinJ toxin-antitoxin module [Pedobacter sp. SG918]